MRKHTPEVPALSLFDGKDTTYIYALIDPRTDQIRYIGKCDTPNERLRAHRCDKANTHKARWIRLLRAAGLRPRMEIIEVVAQDNWADREKFWIAYYRAQGLRLTNITDGGDGAPGRRLTDASKEHLRSLRKGKALSAEHRAKLADAWKFRDRSVIDKLMAGCRAYHAGAKRSAEWCQNISEGQRGRKPSAETLQRLRDSHAQEWLVISPVGTELRIKNLEDFARQNSLSASGLANVAKGKVRTWRGWKCHRIGEDDDPIIIPWQSKAKDPETLREIYRAAHLKFLKKWTKDWLLIAPDGTRHVIHNLARFCREKGLSSGALCDVASGKHDHSHGWVCRKIGSDGQPIEPEPRKLLSKEERNQINSHCIQKAQETRPKNYLVTTPDGVEMQITNLRKFCRENGLDDSCMGAVCSGKTRTHKGWKCVRLE